MKLKLTKRQSNYLSKLLSDHIDDLSENFPYSYKDMETALSIANKMPVPDDEKVESNIIFGTAEIFYDGDRWQTVIRHDSPLIIIPALHGGIIYTEHISTVIMGRFGGELTVFVQLKLGGNSIAVELWDTPENVFEEIRRAIAKTPKE